jgi:uncharacterized protein
MIAQSSFSQDYATLIYNADTSFLKADYPLAEQGYRRALFFSGKEDKRKLNRKIAECLQWEYLPEKAGFFCDTALFYAKDDTERTEDLLLKIRCLIMEKNFGYALMKLQELNTDSCRILDPEKNLLLGIAHLGCGNSEKACHFLELAQDSTKTADPSRLSPLNKQGKRLNQPNPALATTMSIVFPGSGQIYDGHFWNGINSLGILTGLTLISYCVPTLTPLTAPFIVRYYAGGIRRANLYAKSKKEEKICRLGQQLIAFYPEAAVLQAAFSFQAEKNDHRRHLLKKGHFTDACLSTAFLVYKACFSSQDIDPCVFSPSCSEYMMETVRKNGYTEGFLDGIDRILRCHPLATADNYSYDTNKNKYLDEP